MDYTLTDIANNALRILGQKQITDIESTSNAHALVMRDAYKHSIRKIQSLYSWPELRTTETLERNPTDHADGSPRWNLPANLLNQEEIILDCNSTIWRLEAGKLITSSEIAPTISYTAYSEEPSTWGVGLVDCISAQLAADTAKRITSDDKTWQAAEFELQRAKSTWISLSIRKSASSTFRARNQSWNRARAGRTGKGYGTVRYPKG